MNMPSLRLNGLSRVKRTRPIQIVVGVADIRAIEVALCLIRTLPRIINQFPLLSHPMGIRPPLPLRFQHRPLRTTDLVIGGMVVAVTPTRIEEATQ